MGSEKKIKKNFFGKVKIVFTIANSVACCHIPCQRYLSAVSVACTHCFMSLFNDQISYPSSIIATNCRTNLLPLPPSFLYSSGVVETSSHVSDF